MTMKNILRNILVGGMAASMLVSCDLDLKPTTEIMIEEGTPLFQKAQDVTDFQLGVLASYRSLFSGSYSISSELMADGFNATLGFGNNYGSVHRADYSFTPSDSYAESLWGAHYLAMKNFNIAIANAEDVAEDADYKINADILNAIARFCRANSYLTLARHYGNAYNPATASTDLCVPLVLVYNQFELPFRATVQEVYDQIYDDLIKAEEIFMAAAEAGLKMNETKLAGQIRADFPTLDAVRALLARYYLDTQDYGSAIDAAEAVIASEAGYRLASSEEEMVNEYTNDNGSEPIVQLYASKKEGAVARTVFTGVTKYQEQKVFSAYFIPSSNLVNAYSAGDLRYTTWFSSDIYPLFSSGNLYTDVVMFTKFLDNPSLNADAIEAGVHAAKPLQIGEMYLIAAEAYAMDGNTNAATQMLNALRTARKAPIVTGDIMEELKLEWFRETAGEGMRLNCLKRWGDGIAARKPQNTAKEVVMTGEGYTDRVIEAGSHIFNWPIPTREIKINRNLVQNDGYGSEE